MTTRIQLKKKAGQIIDSYDIYIGPKIHNIHWQLNESKWYNGKVSSLMEYKLFILNTPELKKSLAELHNKILGCFCSLEKKCHGDILIDLIKQEGEEIDEDTNCKIHYIKSSINPFSNFYLCQLKYKKIIFNSVVHAYYWAKALMIKKHSAPAKEILNALSPRESFHLFTKYHSPMDNNFLEFSSLITLMFKLICLKYKCCSRFRKACVKYKNYFLVENSADKFWGKGSIISDKIATLSGRNIFGWILMFFIDHNVSPPPKLCSKQKLHNVAPYNKSLRDGLSIIESILPHKES